MTTEQLKTEIERAQWTTLTWSLLTAFSSSVLRSWHSWSLLAVPLLLLAVTCWSAARTVRLRRQARRG